MSVEKISPKTKYSNFSSLVYYVGVWLDWWNWGANLGLVSLESGRPLLSLSLLLSKKQPRFKWLLKRPRKISLTEVLFPEEWAYSKILFFPGPFQLPNSYNSCMVCSTPGLQWLPFSKLYWCDPGVWRCQFKTCWCCKCCWWWLCWQQFVADSEVEVCSKS